MENTSIQKINPDLLAYTGRANGMLPDNVYEELWRTSCHVKGETYIEIGTAHGTATIALALGAKDSGYSVKIYTIDSMGGKFSSRSKYGSPQDNRKIAEDNFKFAGIDDCIDLFLGTTDEFIKSDREISNISLLMLDADGRIDRDIAHFYESLQTEAVIIIDDTDNNVYISKSLSGFSFVDLKHKITSLLLEAFVAENYLILDQKVYATAFCRKGNKKMEYDKFWDLTISCYRELVFSALEGDQWSEIMMLLERKSELNQALKIKEALPPFIYRIGKILRLLKLI